MAALYGNGESRWERSVRHPTTSCTPFDGRDLSYSFIRIESYNRRDVCLTPNNGPWELFMSLYVQ